MGDAATALVASVADKVELGTIDVAGATELLEGTHATMGRYGVRVGKLEIVKSGGRSLAEYRRYGNFGDPKLRTELRFQRVAANAKTIAAKQEREHAKFVAHHERGIADRTRQVADATRPQQLRDIAQTALEKLLVTKRWAVWEDSARPVFSFAAHEAAHALMDAKSLERPWAKALEANGVTALDRFAVSEYAASSSSELFAEAMAMQAEGRQLPARIQRALDEVLRDL